MSPSLKCLRHVCVMAAVSAGFTSLALGQATHTVASPDAQTQVEITLGDGQLHYAVKWKDQAILLPSPLSVLPGGAVKISRVEQREADRIWKPVWGQFSQVRDHYRELRLHLDHGTGDAVVLECRVFDDGVGLRFTSDGKPTATIDAVDFRTDYRWPESSALYWTQGEREPAGPVSLEAFANDPKLRPATPVVAEIDPKTCAAVLESDLYSAERFSTVRFGHSEDEQKGLAARSPAKVGGAAWQTPWRVLLVGTTPGDLLVSRTPLNLAAECALPDTAWIKPGKTLWDWRVHGYQAGDVRYGIDTESYLRFIDFAAANNIQYFLIDDAWFTSAKEDRLQASAEIDLPKIMARARDRGVGVLLYYDQKKGVIENSKLFPQLAEAGAVGTKYGFMGNNADFTRGAIAAAAEQKLLINFHDAPCPMTGVERTLPNAITREYCHAQQDSRRAFTPTAFLKMAMINALTGPLDQANGVFGLTGVNAGEREKGPRIRESYNSTVASEAARVLVIFSGLICLPDAPEEYAKKADLFEFLREMPATWDETRILNSRIGQSITTARRSGRAWFVGSVINEAGGDLAIPLDFLDADTEYDVTFYTDAPDSHCVNNREAYRVVRGRAKHGEVIQARLAPGGGHCMWIRPVAATGAAQ